MKETARNTLVRLINARFSLPTWLWVFASMAVGFLVFSYALAKDPAIASFANALPFGGVVWGLAVSVMGVCSIIGMTWGSRRFQQIGSMGSFVLWLFGAIAFGQQPEGWGNVIIFGLPMCLFWGYKYLATYVREFPRL